MGKALPKTKPRPQDSGESDQMQTTAIHIRREDWNLLRSVAYRRAEHTGGRASVSEVVRTLIEAHRNDLVKEARDRH
jgi:transketolase N-terminal domain/subunit